MSPPMPTATKESYLAGNQTAAARATTQKPHLLDTLTICTEDPQLPIQFSIYGYIITTSASQVLKSLFNNPKARAKGIILHEIQADTLRGYVHWLHTRELLSKKPEGFISYPELINFYLLGEVLKDPIFCEQAVDFMLLLRYDGRKWPGYKITNDVWERTSPDSPLREIMKELWMSTNVDKATRYFKAAPESGYHKEFILSLLEELVSRGLFVKEVTFSGRVARRLRMLVASL